MTIKYASKFGPNLQNTLDAIGHSRDFNAGTLKGKTLPIPNYVGQTGSLPKEWRGQMVKDSPRYVVYSYETPIAWIAKRDGKFVAVVPPVKYSSTTSNHQSVARRGLGEYTEQFFG